METMTQENKELLIRDLCGRLPYGVKVKLGDNPNIFDLEYRIKFAVMYGDSDKLEDILDITNIKPYLFPLSSMTEEQEEEFKNLFYRFHESAFIFNERFAYDRYSIKDIGFYPCYLQDWLLKNNFDIYGLIPMGLAIDATDKNIY